MRESSCHAPAATRIPCLFIQESGNYSLSVLVGKDKEVVGGRPLTIEALPGALSSQQCGLVGKKLGQGSSCMCSMGRL